jgi:hypothetical protein
MMGGGTSILLKTGRSAPESAKQPEIRLAIFLKVLHTARSRGENPLGNGGRHMLRLCGRELPLDMANCPGFYGFVIRTTNLAEKLAQYPARECREKFIKVFVTDYIL